MKNISTGFGLCAIAAAVALYPVLDRFAPIGKEAHAGVPASAITSAALAQIAPTIVWYGHSAGSVLLRAWSTGRIEGLYFDTVSVGMCGGLDDFSFRNRTCGVWCTITDPSQGYSAASDSNFDAKVDGADLAMLLGNWGDAPRHDIPPSDCPLNLINP